VTIEKDRFTPTSNALGALGHATKWLRRSARCSDRRRPGFRRTHGRVGSARGRSDPRLLIAGYFNMTHVTESATMDRLPLH
jgi:hypothetical protein